MKFNPSVPYLLFIRDKGSRWRFLIHTFSSKKEATYQGWTIRRCIDCLLPVAGGPTRCHRCAGKQERSAEIAKLQKDYDKLSQDYWGLVNANTEGISRIVKAEREVKELRAEVERLRTKAPSWNVVTAKPDSLPNINELVVVLSTGFSEPRFTSRMPDCFGDEQWTESDGWSRPIRIGDRWMYVPKT